MTIVRKSATRILAAHVAAFVAAAAGAYYWLPTTANKENESQPPQEEASSPAQSTHRDANKVNKDPDKIGRALQALNAAANAPHASRLPIPERLSEFDRLATRDTKAANLRHVMSAKVGRAIHEKCADLQHSFSEIQLAFKTESFKGAARMASPTLEVKRGAPLSAEQRDCILGAVNSPVDLAPQDGDEFIEFEGDVNVTLRLGPRPKSRMDDSQGG